MPITVIGSKFNIEYEKSEADAEALRTQRAIELARGLKWEEVDLKPPKGTEIKNELLAAALRDKTEFSQADLNRFGVSGVLVGGGGREGGRDGGEGEGGRVGGWLGSHMTQTQTHSYTHTHTHTHTHTCGCESVCACRCDPVRPPFFLGPQARRRTVSSRKRCAKP